MRQQPYCTELGATAACTRRLCEAVAYCGSRFPTRRQAKAFEAGEMFLGDSWFTGIRVAEWAASQGHSYFGALKTSIKCTPFDELITRMSDWPSGSNLVMECTSPKSGHKLICVGYKYSASKVLVFLGTKNAGTTKLGDPYIAKFPDANGNVAQRSVPRPDVISKYFNGSNVIDTHNQSRQFELALEKRWVTQNCFFRVDTTLIGMVVTDCWRAYKHALKKPITIKEFADSLSADCIYNPYSDTATVNSFLAIGGNEQALPPAEVGGGRQSDVSAVTEASTSTTVNVLIEHPFNNNPEREQSGNGRPIRRHCKFPSCSKTTAKMCFNRGCLQHSYESSHGSVFGVFYCTDHQYKHYERVLEGNGNV